jgi:hypothetical protein
MKRIETADFREAKPGDSVNGQAAKPAKRLVGPLLF